MKTKLLIIILIKILTTQVLISQTINIETAKKAAINKLAILPSTSGLSIKHIYPIVLNNNEELFYCINLSPSGYIIVTANKNLPPIIAYSLINDLDNESKFINILRTDILMRLNAIKKLPAEIIEKRKADWNLLLSGNAALREYEQWPVAGTTSTGGWLETNWHQEFPYNQMCPIDPVDNIRSIVGCPATAMAQIFNYHKTTNNTQFDDGDDYYHNYPGRNYWIDNAHAQRGFPSFPELNDYLNELNERYLNNSTITNQDRAALSFAFGVAAKQVYTSSSSGTFAVIQAYNALARFGCNTLELLVEPDTSLFPRLISNMKSGLPALLAVVDQAWYYGHNVVVDGYNTNNYFHVNFGWGGQSNGWYLLPQEIPYSLTVIEGVVVDILKDNAISTSNHNNSHNNEDVKIFPNPASEYISIVFNDCKTSFSICDINGKEIINRISANQSETIDISSLSDGVYIIKINGNNRIIKRFIICR